METMAYTKGLHELGDGLFAYLQPDGGYGWSNAGLVVGDDSSLLVDTLIDLNLTRQMLDAMGPITDTKPIDKAVNTHGDGDHCYGNGALAAQTEIYATPGAVEGMQEVPPALMHTLLNSDLGPVLTPYVREAFGAFDVEGLELRLPSQTFEGRLQLDIGGRTIEVVEVGPAHTVGDAIVHLPDAEAVFTGDILFVGGTPVVWAGPVGNWIAACDRLMELDARILIPGHGPVTDNSGVRDIKRYFEYVSDQARARFEAGLDARAAADDIDVGEFADWGNPERIVANVDAVYRELDDNHPEASHVELFAGMAAYAKRH
jgi:cyclase